MIRGQRCHFGGGDYRARESYEARRVTSVKWDVQSTKIALKTKEI